MMQVTVTDHMPGVRLSQPALGCQGRTTLQHVHLQHARCACDFAEWLLRVYSTFKDAATCI